MNLIKKYLCLIIFSSIFSINYTFATCTIDNTNDPSGTRLPTGGKLLTYGQAFKACDSGKLTSITVNTGGGDIELFLIKGDGTTMDLTTPLQTFPGSPAGDITLYLSNAFLVEQGVLYAFAIGNVDDVLFDWSPDNMDDGQNAFRYAGGGFIAQPNNDLYYAVTIEGIPVINIPTLSQWGLLVIALLIMNLSIYFIQGFKLNRL